MRFLDALGGRWNISLFHYRNHGADPGRVLAASKCRPPRTPCSTLVVRLGYPAVPEERQPGLLALPGRQRRLSPGPARSAGRCSCVQGKARNSRSREQARKSQGCWMTKP